MQWCIQPFACTLTSVRCASSLTACIRMSTKRYHTCTKQCCMPTDPLQEEPMISGISSHAIFIFIYSFMLQRHLTSCIDSALTPAIEDPNARMQWTLRPMPPADFEIRAQRSTVLKIPSMESSAMVSKKQEDICGRQVPALNSVGEA